MASFAMPLSDLNDLQGEAFSGVWFVVQLRGRWQDFSTDIERRAVPLRQMSLLLNNCSGSEQNPQSNMLRCSHETAAKFQ